VTQFLYLNRVFQWLFSSWNVQIRQLVILPLWNYPVTPANALKHSGYYIYHLI
jgi:hypothetical protein